MTPICLLTDGVTRVVCALFVSTMMEWKPTPTHLAPVFEADISLVLPADLPQIDYMVDPLRDGPPPTGYRHVKVVWPNGQAMWYEEEIK